MRARLCIFGLTVLSFEIEPTYIEVEEESDSEPDEDERGSCITHPIGFAPSDFLIPAREPAWESP